MSKVNYLRQDVDYLGFLESQLRGLGGIDTMVYELIQNADDVHTEDGQPGASRITFDVCDDALIVENDGVFREKDFGRMQRIAGGAKRYEADTTGAFGIGFISVYQVTDAPEILSSDRRWVIHPEEEDPDHRIYETKVQTQHTVFRLPWADDPRSAVRRGLRLEHVDLSSLDVVAAKIAEAARGSALFLRQIERMDVLRNKKLVQAVRRDPGRAAGTVNLFLSGHVSDLQSWTIFDLGFEDRAAELRRQHLVQVESSRHTRVQLAVCTRASQTGRLYATLPTNTTFDLPFSINADFFPTPDRKAILFGEDYQGEWNRAAIEMAAEGLDEHLEAVRDLFGAVSFVGMLDRVQALYAAPDERKPDRSFNAFWEALAPTLSERAVVCPVDGAWVTPREARLLQGKAELEATVLLTQLGLKIVSRDLARFTNILTHRSVGTPLLSIRDFVDLLAPQGVQAGMRLGDCPEPFHHQDSWVRLWDTLEELLEPSRLQRNSTRESTEIDRLRDAPIALDESGVLRDPSSLYRGDRGTRLLFPLAPWLADGIQSHPLFERLVPSFGPREAIEHLLDLSGEMLESLWHDGILSLQSLYAWFNRYVDTDLQIPNLARDFRRLCIWPSSSRLLSIDDLFVPTGFRDPLGIASFVDLDLIQGHMGLAHRMGMRTLDLRTYAIGVVPEWLREHPDRSVDARRALVRLLAEHLGQIGDDHQVLRTLSALPLIECADGSYGSASEVYADNENTRLLGQTARQVSRWYGQSRAIDDLYKWLGVAEEPRPQDLVACVRDHLPKTRDDRYTRWVGRLFTYLSEHWHELGQQDKQKLEPLKTLKWLPGTRDSTRWHVPSELYATFREFLFSSQGNFLDLPRRVQDQGAAFMAWLQVSREPPTELVVRHLMHCCEQNIPVNSEVYLFLNQHADEPQVKWLCGKPCILTSDGRYIDPRKAFWYDNPYGEYRITLSSDDLRYVKLYSLLGVRDGPDDQDHIDVLLDIATVSGSYNHVLEDQSHAVVLRCWQLLSDSIRQGHLDPRRLEGLKQQKVAPNRDKYLQMPERLFMEDRPHIADHFREALGPSLIARPAGAWPALHAAGVRRLSDAIRVEMLNAVDSTDDSVLTQRLRERLPLFARVVEGVRQDAGVRDATLLAGLQAHSAISLLVQYVLPIANRSINSDAVSLSVLVEGETLYTVHNGSVPWAAIARELAYILKPDGEVTSLAPGLKEALAYDTLKEAGQALDQLDIPPLAEAAVAVEVAAPTLTVAGTEAHHTEYDQPHPSSDGDHEEVAKVPEQVADDGVEETFELDLQDLPFARQPNKVDAPRGSCVVGQQPSAGGTPSGSTFQPNPAQSGVSGASRDSRRRSEERLVSYVLPEGEGGEEPDNARTERLRTVEQAGIDAAVRYEDAAGRKAKVQKHLNRGYDIVSTGADGSRRYIEVKALSGTWDSRNPVRMTPAEMEEAQDPLRQGSYWLYVVEHALGSEPMLYVISDPAARVHRYCFDHGWMGIAEHVPAMSSAPDSEEA